MEFSVYIAGVLFDIGFVSTLKEKEIKSNWIIIACLCSWFFSGVLIGLSFKED